MAKNANTLSLFLFGILLYLTGCDTNSKLPGVIEEVNDQETASHELQKSSFSGGFIPSVTETVEEGVSLNLRTVFSNGRKSGLAVPAGSLAVGSEVTLEEASTIVYDLEVTEFLDLKDNSKVLTASDAVLVSSTSKEEAKNAMVLILPVPAFELKIAKNPFENLVVVSRVIDQDDGGLIKVRIINPDQISLTADGIEVEIFEFGAYQATIISEKPSAGNKIIVSVSDIENKAKREVIQNILDIQELVQESISPAISQKETKTVEIDKAEKDKADDDIDKVKQDPPKEVKIEIPTDVFNKIVTEIIKKEIEKQEKEEGEAIKEASEAIPDQKDSLKNEISAINSELRQLNIDYWKIWVDYRSVVNEIEKTNMRFQKGKSVDWALLAENLDKANELNQTLLGIEEQIARCESQIVQLQEQIDALNQDRQNLYLFRVTSLGTSIDMLGMRKFRAFADPEQKDIVRLAMVLPLDVSLYGEVVVRKVNGWDPPHRDCVSDGEIVGIWDKSQMEDGGALMVDDAISEHASYRVCVFDKQNNLIHTQSEDSYLSLSFH
ncbi:MAG: hypothetical protein HYW48_01515 [Deltaproteobacteria bacterium]|nr:hypothetical protein [Deltaproteobacteria bacterium]